jgi:hypothetical protein
MTHGVSSSRPHRLRRMHTLGGRAFSSRSAEMPTVQDKEGAWMHVPLNLEEPVDVALACLWTAPYSLYRHCVAALSSGTSPGGPAVHRHLKRRGDGSPCTGSLDWQRSSDDARHDLGAGAARVQPTMTLLDTEAASGELFPNAGSRGAPHLQVERDTTAQTQRGLVHISTRRRAALYADESEGCAWPNVPMSRSATATRNGRAATMATVSAKSTPTFSTAWGPVGALSCRLFGGVDRRYLAEHIANYEFGDSSKANSVSSTAALTALHTSIG